MELFVIITGVVWCLVNLFVYCYFGHMAAESYTLISEHLCESNWYNWPMKYKKQLILMIQVAQEEHLFDGFGIAQLNLYTYVRVCEKRVFSILFIKSNQNLTIFS